MDRRAWIAILMVLVLGLVLLSGTASAAKRSGSESVDHGDYFSVKIEFTGGELMDADYTVTVTGGPNVDVYFMDGDSFADFEANDTFVYDITMSELNTRSAEGSTTLLFFDTYYLVVDNSDRGTVPSSNDSATFDWELNTKKNTVVEDAVSAICYAAIAVIVVIVVVIILVVYLVSRKKDAPAPPVPPGQAPPPYPGAAPQQPQYPQQYPPQQPPPQYPPQQPPQQPPYPPPQ